MDTLIIYDAWQDADRISRQRFSAGSRIYLYPLTSRNSATEKIAESLGDKGYNCEVLQTAQLLNEAANRIRDKYLRFIAELPNKPVFGSKDLRQLFALDNFATLWWFSPISEKSLFKSGAFNNLAHLESITGVITDKKIGKITWDCRNSRLKEALEIYAAKKAIAFSALSATSADKDTAGGYLSTVLYLLRHAFRLFLRIRKIQKALAGIKRNTAPSAGSLMIITAYPNLDIDAAKKGVFKNKFYPFLQEELEKIGQNIIWGCMYVENKTATFEEALRYAGLFVKNGYCMYFLEEFIFLSAQAQALVVMFENVLRYLRAEKTVKALHDFNGYNCYSLFRDDWRRSFAGYIGYEGILRYDMFKAALRRLKAEKCLYMCEMQAWEKSLEMAKKSVRSDISLFAYQHGSIARMCLSYFSYPGEIAMDGPYSLRGPDVLLCNGQVAYDYLKESGWPGKKIRLVDAIRYNYLKAPLMSTPASKKNVLLLALSLSQQENSAILTMVCEAFRGIKEVEIWLKPHPFIQIDKVFESAGLTNESGLFQIKDGPISGLLSQARVVIAGESSVSFEALAHGCEVLVINTCEWINMSPLSGVASSAVTHINSAAELLEKVKSIFRKPYEREYFAEDAKRLIHRYFCLDDNTDVPRRFLGALKGGVS